MKNLIIFSMLAVMVVINFTGCGKAQERSFKPNKKIEGQVIAISGLADITQAENQNSEENITFKKKLIAKLDTEEKRTQATQLLAQNKLGYIVMDKKVLLLEFVPANSNKHISASVKTETVSETAEVASATTEVTEATSETVEVAVVSETKLYSTSALVAMKSGQEVNSKVSVEAENQFAILAEIAAQVGILENETTDYNEKKSTLKFTETSLDQAQVLMLK